MKDRDLIMKETEMQMKEAQSKNDELKEIFNDHVRKIQEMEKICDSKESELQQLRQRISTAEQAQKESESQSIAKDEKMKKFHAKFQQMKTKIEELQKDAAEKEVFIYIFFINALLYY